MLSVKKLRGLSKAYPKVAAAPRRSLRLIALAHGADILVHSVADLGYLERHGFTGAALERLAGLHTDVTEVGGVAERAGVRELILTHYLPAEPHAITQAEWAGRAARGFGGTTAAGSDGLRRTLPRAD